MLEQRGTLIKVRRVGIKIRIVLVRVFNAIDLRSKHAANNIRLIFQIFKAEFKLHLFQPKPVITIFGSCRQDSIYDHFKVTNIRNGLTYPHYSKEVIQAINYCRDTGFSVPDIAFRNTQIFSQLATRKSLKKSFDRTDIFIIEIASMLEYKYDGVYLHHEIYDNPTTHQKFQGFDLATVERTEQTISELMSDLETIVELLRGKDVIFACHFNTRKTGRRAELESVILQFCKERNIKTFVPRELLEFYTENEVFVEEKILSHFSEFGHRIAGYRFKELIEIVSLKRESIIRPLVQKLEKPPLGIDGYTSGFGDFLNGALKVYEMARRLNRVPLVDLGDSLLSDHLRNSFDSEGFGETRKVFHEHHDFAFSQTTTVFTNKVPRDELNEESRDFIFRNCLSQQEGQRRETKQIFEQLKLIRNQYVILHVRVDDKFDSNPSQSVLLSIQEIIRQLDFNKSTRLLLLSNSNKVRAHFASLGIESPSAHVQHSADPEATQSSISNMLTEFFILGNSKHIYQLSTHEWGSGFSSLAAKLFDVPISKVRIAK